MNGNNLRERTDKSEKNIEGNCEQSKISEACHPDLKKCEICCRQFESVLELKYHFEICKKGLECNHCQKILKVLNYLNNIMIFVMVQINTDVLFVVRNLRVRVSV